MRFSQRKGLTTVRQVIQAESMDDDLRNTLWNIVDANCWQPARRRGGSMRYGAGQAAVFAELWLHFFKLPLDTLEEHWHAAYGQVRDIYFGLEWHGVYDLLEFLAGSRNLEDREGFVRVCNAVLERELSAYRLVGGRMTQITDEEEIGEIEEALTVGEPYGAVRTHLSSALKLMADRAEPDYRNSIKESISGVEALCKLLTGSPKATLGQALKEVEAKAALHPALRSALEKLYGFTSDADGIRHALMQQADLRFEDAKFMLVACSAFVNYLIAKVGGAEGAQ